MTTNPAGGSDLPIDTVPVYILAGGESRRFGSDKARTIHGGVPLLVGVARVLEPVSSRITVVAARDGAYDDLGLRTIGDVVSQKGPLGGLLTAIEDCGADQWLFLSACDWVGIRTEWVVELLRARTPKARAVVYKNEHYEPLFTLYHTSLRHTVAALIEADRLGTRNVFGEAVTVTLPQPDGWNAVINLNRPPGAAGV